MTTNSSREKPESNSASNILASCHNVSFISGNVKILENISIAISRNEIVTIIGPNGSGKTTTIKILLGLQKPSAGAVELQKDLCIGYMPQKIAIQRIMPLTVRRFLRLTGKRLRAIGDVEEVAAKLGIGGILQRQVHDISGGEMQRVLLARALLIKPDLLVLDEPTQGLDVQAQEEFYRILEYVKKDYGCGILMVSHDLHVVMAKTDRVICLNQHICCEGHPEDISKHPEYLSMFGKKPGDGFAIYPHHHDHVHK